MTFPKDPRINPLIADDLERFDDGSDEYARAIAESQPPARPQVRVPNEPHGLRVDVRAVMGAALASGNKASAVALAMEAGLGHKAAVSYVEGMSEYQTYLNHHGGEKLQPRTFPADGPEPPPEVTVLRDDYTDHDDMGYLIRAEDGWCWSPSPKLVPPDHGRIQSWKDAASSADGNLWEVV